MSLFFYVVNDNRLNKNSIDTVFGSLDGRFLFFDNVTQQIVEGTNLVDFDKDKIISISLYDNSIFLTNTTLFDNSYEVNDTFLKGCPEIDKIQFVGDHFRKILETCNVKRNLAVIELFSKTSKFTIKEPVGYNSIIKLTNNDNTEIHYISDPLLYTSTIDGIIDFYFSPNPKSGYYKNYLENYSNLLLLKNPNYDPSISTALGIPDINGWREIINAEYNGMEFNFYPNDVSNKWLLEGLGNNIKLRLLDKHLNPLPFSAWIPSVNIHSGLDQYSKLGSTLPVYKVEARYITSSKK